jgi:hypothetical protein
VNLDDACATTMNLAADVVNVVQITAELRGLAVKVMA